MATTKRKKLTNAQKKINKEVREELRKAGYIPPVKQKLNRVKFTKEVTEEMKDFLNFSNDIFIYEAIWYMLPDITINRKVTPEQVGVLKMLKLAMEIKKFKDAKESKGEKKYAIRELFDVINPILKL